jgi:hypothetical protein
MRGAFVDREAERRPHLFGLKAVAHEVAGFDGELPALVTLLSESSGVVAQRDAAEGDVARPSCMT